MSEAATLKFGDIQVSNERETYNQLRLFFQDTAETVANGFSEKFKETFPNMDVLHEKCNEEAYGWIGAAIDQAIRKLIEYNVVDIDDDHFANEYLPPYFTWDDDFQLIDDQYMSIVLKSEELDEYRTHRRENRSQWIGGGFGFGGALKGAAQAAALNAASGLIHGAWNLSAKALQSAGNSFKKKALYDDPKTREHLVNALYRQIMNIHLAVVDAINEQKPGQITGFVSEEAASKATRLVENVSRGRVSGGQERLSLVEAFRLNPYDPETYRCWMKRFGNEDGSLEVMAKHFGVREIGVEKTQIFQEKCATLDWSTLEHCKQNLQMLESYAKSIGFLDFDEFKEQQLAESIARDLEERTFDGTVYSTVVGAKKAQEEYASRTFKGVTYATYAEAEHERSKRSVGFLLGIAILFMPYVFVFFTLRKGYSTTVRIICFGYLIAIVGWLQATKEMATSQAREKVSATAVSALAASSVNQPNFAMALEHLYHARANPSGTTVLENGQEVSLFHTTQVGVDDNNQRSLIFVQRISPNKQSYADGSEIDVISFRRAGNQWQVDAKASSLFNAGSYGGNAGIAKDQTLKVEQHAIADNTYGIFIPVANVHQGYNHELFEMVSVSPGALEYTGQIEIGANNQGACDQSERNGPMACFGWKGKAEIVKGESTQFAKIKVKKSGTDSINGEIVPAKDSMYVKPQQETKYISL